MKVNGTTVPTGRDNTYSSKETKKDIQTGRAVYADKDKYEDDSAYKADIDKYVKEGFHLIFGTPDNPSEGGSGGSSGSGGTEPIVLMIATEEVPCPSDPSQITQQITYNHSWQEIYDALSVGRLVVIPFISGSNSAYLSIVLEAIVDGECYVSDTSNRVYAFADANSLVYIEHCGK